MSWEHDGPRLRVYIGDVTCADDPRGREFGVALFLGEPNGEFDASPTPQYGSWGGYVTAWRWGASISVRGPILGHYPPDPDRYCGAVDPDGYSCIRVPGHTADPTVINGDNHLTGVGHWF